MSDKVDEVLSPQPSPLKPTDREPSYDWMKGKEAFLELNPRNLPPMLRKAHAKHVKARLAAKGK